MINILSGFQVHCSRTSHDSCDLWFMVTLSKEAHERFGTCRWPQETAFIHPLLDVYPDVSLHLIRQWCWDWNVCKGQYSWNRVVPLACPGVLALKPWTLSWLLMAQTKMNIRVLGGSTGRSHGDNLYWVELGNLTYSQNQWGPFLCSVILKNKDSLTFYSNTQLLSIGA